MQFKPFNRHLVLEPVENEAYEKKSTILVPDDYVQTVAAHEMYKLIDVADDCGKVTNLHIGHYVIVNNCMVEKIKVHGVIHYLLLENHVYGILYNAGEKCYYAMTHCE